MYPIRVMIVEDSPTVCECLAQSFAEDQRFTVVAKCENAEQAIDCLDQAAPDVISMDLHLPGMSGLDATRQIMEIRPTPIVIVSRSVNAEECDTTSEALRAGAVSALEGLSSRPHSDFAAKLAKIRRELAVMSQVKVVRQRFNRCRAAVAGVDEHRPLLLPPHSIPERKPACLVGIVASTGGPQAVETILRGVGSDCPLPIVLVQHITASFQNSFVSWLNQITPQTVKVAGHGEFAESGHVYVAPSDRHLLVCGNRLVLNDSRPVGGQRPSGTLLLESMADTLGSQAIGVLLTGMGDDGAAGLLALRRAGGFTIAEDESTAVVNGMPGAARSLGASRVSLPRESIAAAINYLARPTQGICT